MKRLANTMGGHRNLRFMVIGLIIFFVIPSYVSLQGRGSQAESAILNNEPVDFVYLYVNGSDPTQIELVNSMKGSSGKVHQAQGKNTLNAGRFRDWGELRYSMRATVHNAPWFRHIYLVLRNNSTQVPTWIKSYWGDRLRIVTHSDIFPNKNDLPTFSSRSIEANVHRIAGLSKRFVLMNDDFFVFSPLSKRFLLPTPTTHYICLNAETTADELAPQRNPTARQLSVQRVNSLLNRAYGYRPRRDDCHAPQVIDVDLMKELQAIFPREFEAVSSNKVRTGGTITVRYLYNHWVLQEKEGFKEVSHWWTLRNALSFGVRSSMLLNRLHFALAALLRPQFIAINDDVSDDTKNLSEILAMVHQFCERHFPWPSPFE